MSHFLRSTSSYSRNLNPLRDYVTQMSIFISKSRDIPLEQAEQFVKKQCQLVMRDPVVTLNDRDSETQDISVKKTTLSNYINTSIAQNHILTPTFTTYLNVNQKRSLLSSFIAENVKIRAKAKKEAYVAKAEGKFELYLSKDNEQSNMKIYNNSLSGAFAQKSSVLYNPTAHSTLTSLTRSVSSISSSSNEKIISGNRHYFNPHLTLNNIIAIPQLTDLNKLNQFMLKYNIYAPTTEDVVKVIKYSSDFYFRDDAFIRTHMVPYIDKLSETEKAAFVYVNDLYQLKEYNPEFVRTFLTQLSNKVTDVTVENYKDVIKNTPEGIINYTHQICFNDVKGLGKDLDKFKAAGVADTVAATALHVTDTLNTYSDMIEALFLTDAMPISIAHMKEMVRRVIVLGDTDSTCFSVDHWVKWYFGEMRFDEKAIAVAGAISFIATETISHLLSIFSFNINVEREHLHTLSMKNEFLWTVHMPTAVSKHYAALTVMKEGYVYAEPDLEIKGVHLKNSAVPYDVIQDSNTIVKFILETVGEGKKISIKYLINHLKNLETSIIDDVYSGGDKYLKKSKIKDVTSYSLGEDLSPYQRHNFWNSTFGTKYGLFKDPPYYVYKIPTTLVNSSSMKAWFLTMKDQELSGKISNYLMELNKKVLPTMYIQDDYVKSNGIPEEIIPIIDIKKIVLDVTKQHRIILDALGIFVKDDLLFNEVFNDYT